MYWGGVGKQTSSDFVSRTLFQASTEEGVGVLNSYSFKYVLVRVGEIAMGWLEDTSANTFRDE